jgi:cysteine synthase B
MRAFGAELVLYAQGRAAWSARATSPSECVPTARGSSSISSPTPTTRSRTTAGTGPESGATPRGTITHFVSAMGTTGTIMGVSRYLKEQNPKITIVGAQPPRARRSRASASGPRPTCRRSSIARASTLEEVSQADAEAMTRRLAREEGISCGVSSGGACAIALRIVRAGRERRDRVRRVRPRRPLLSTGTVRR